MRRVGILLIVATLGVGASLGVAACGEDREGDVEFENGTGTAGTVGTGTVGTETAPTETVETEPETETVETETSP